MLEMEKQTIADVVDFSKILMQKFDKLEIKNNNLIISYQTNSAKCKIKTNEKSLQIHLYNQVFSDQKTETIADLKATPLFDLEYQNEIKKYIDDLIFALYFKTELDEIGFENASRIKEICNKNEFYNLLNENK